MSYAEELNELKNLYNNKLKAKNKEIENIIRGKLDTQLSNENKITNNEIGVPNYWKQVLIHSNFFKHLNNKDLEILSYLDNIHIDIIDDTIVII